MALWSSRTGAGLLSRSYASAILARATSERILYETARTTKTITGLDGQADACKAFVKWFNSTSDLHAGMV